MRSVSSDACVVSDNDPSQNNVSNRLEHSIQWSFNFRFTRNLSLWYRLPLLGRKSRVYNRGSPDEKLQREAILPCARCLWIFALPPLHKPATSFLCCLFNLIDCKAHTINILNELFKPSFQSFFHLLYSTKGSSHIWMLYMSARLDMWRPMIDLSCHWNACCILESNQNKKQTKNHPPPPKKNPTQTKTTFSVQDTPVHFQ